MWADPQERSMTDIIKFTNNFTDHSTDTGYQFEFHCDHCHDGVRSSFHPSALGTASTVLNAASSLFGGMFGIANAANSARSATWQREHDTALRSAMDEVKTFFTRCPRCTSYVCKSCWNESAGLCV